MEVSVLDADRQLAAQLAAQSNFLLLQPQNESRLAILLSLKSLLLHPSVEADFALRKALKSYRRHVGKCILTESSTSRIDSLLADFELLQLFILTNSNNSEANNPIICQFSPSGQKGI